jgi:hypothetical protein
MKTLYFDLTNPTQAAAYGALILAYTRNGLTFELERHGDWSSTAPEGTVGVTLTGGY